ncbi:MAG: hypothetical protein ABIK68_14555 [bacterium]
MEETKLTKKKIVKHKIERFDERLLQTQEKASDRYVNYFSLNIALAFMLMSGASFAFVGRDCYGMIPMDSPGVVFIIMCTVMILFQTFISIPLNALRIVKLIGIFYLTFSLTSELWGLYSIEYLPDVQNACKPTLYMTSAYGLVRATLPDFILIIICFMGNRDEQKA